MSLKSILVVASGAPQDARVLAVAAKLAKQFAAEARVTPAYPDPAADLVYYGTVLQRELPSEIAERIRASERESQMRLDNIARDAAKAEGADIVVEPRALSPTSALSPSASLSDLVVFGAEVAREPSLLGGLFTEALLHARAPILLVKKAPWNAERIAIAWDGSAQAGRAVRAALPILAAAKEAIILTNADDVESIAKPAEPERLQAYLARHGVTHTSARAVRGDNVANSLLKAAEADGCGLIVAGAYGRPRLFELALGGTTRALVSADAGPHVLLAH